MSEPVSEHEAWEQKIDRISDHLAQLIRIVGHVQSSNKRIEERLGRIEERLDQVEERLDRVEARLDRVEERLDRVEERLDRVEVRLDRVEERLDRVEERLDQLETEMGRLNAAMVELNVRVTAKIDQFKEHVGASLGKISVRIEEEAAERKADIALLKNPPKFPPQF